MEVGLSLVLLFVAGLLLRSFHELRTVELGFDTRSVLSLSLRLPAASYPDPGDRVRFFEDLETRLRALPGVEEVSSGFGSTFELDDWIISSFVLLDRPEPPRGQRDLANIRVVTPGYFELLDIPLIEGRVLEPWDRAGARQVAVVSERFRRQHYPGGSPLGQFLGALLYNVEPHDLVTLVAVTGILLLVVIAAILVPARRASRLSPVTALREG